VNIESSGTLYLGWFNTGNTINAGGAVNLTSDNSDVDVYQYYIYANGVT